MNFPEEHINFFIGINKEHCVRILDYLLKNNLPFHLEVEESDLLSDQDISLISKQRKGISTKIDFKNYTYKDTVWLDGEMLSSLVSSAQHENITLSVKVEKIMKIVSENKVVFYNSFAHEERISIQIGSHANSMLKFINNNKNKKLIEGIC